MKALVIKGPHNAGIVDVEKPKPTGDIALVREQPVDDLGDEIVLEAADVTLSGASRRKDGGEHLPEFLCDLDFA